MTPQQANISQQLRDLPQELRRTPKPLAEIIPLLLAAADELDRRAPAPTSEPGARDAELIQLRAQNTLLVRLYEAAAKLVKAKGRFHTEANYGALVRAYDLVRTAEFPDLATPASPAVPDPKPQYKFDDAQGAVTLINTDKMPKYTAVPADPAPLVAQASPVAWFEAEPSAKGRPLREVMGGMIYSTRWHTTKPDVLNNALWPLYEHPAPEASPLVEDAQRIVAGKAMSPIPINDAEMAALARFHECVTDGEGWDVEKAMMQRLARIGLVRRVTANFYEHTEFGLAMLDEWVPERATTGNATADDGKDK